MKKNLTLLLITGFLLSLSACSQNEPTSNSIDNSEAINSETITTEEVTTTPNLNSGQSNSYKENELPSGSLDSNTGDNIVATEETTTAPSNPDEYTAHTSRVREILKRTDTSQKQFTKSYPQNELINSIEYLMFNHTFTITYLDELYPIEYLITPENSVAYCVYKLEEGGELFVFFDGVDEECYFVTHIFVVKKRLVQKDFSEIKEGKTLADVEKIDPGTKIINSIKSSYLYHNETLHIVEDGFIKITYTGGKYDDDTLSYKNAKSYKVKSVEFIPNGGVVTIPEELWNFFINHSFNYAVLDGDYPKA